MSVSFKTVKEASIKNGTRVLLRGDFDVAFKGRRIADNFRIRETIPTLRYILKKGGHPRIIAHLKRPHGKRVLSLSLRSVARYLGKSLRKEVIFVSDPFSPAVFEKYNRSPHIIFFENIRFWPGEEKNDRHFAASLARWGDIYVNEAFANSHRPHASMEAITRFLPAFAGLRLAEEIFYLSRIFLSSPPPRVAIMGGAKLETKIPLIERFLRSGSMVLLGGALVNTIFYAKGISVGKSPIDKNLLKKALRLDKIKSKLLLPIDLVVAKNPGARPRVVSVSKIGHSESNFDIGPATVGLFKSALSDARTIVWNGPLGLAEVGVFSRGTTRMARALKNIRAFKIIGGGDTIAILRSRGLLGGFTHVSTGGGAMLEFLAGKKLPAVEALKR